VPEVQLAAARRARGRWHGNAASRIRQVQEIVSGDWTHRSRLCSKDSLGDLEWPCPAPDTSKRSFRMVEVGAF
jgi:hypothetical protein